MSPLIGRLIKVADYPSDIKGRIMAVEYDNARGFVALLLQDDGKLTGTVLEGAEVVQQVEPRPVPMPITPHGVTR